MEICTRMFGQDFVMENVLVPRNLIYLGIFPEGGSHDRLELLPLKAGICIMALGAMEKYNAPVTIVPCGFNYYNPQNFRSKVIMEFGPPYKIPQ